MQLNHYWSLAGVGFPPDKIYLMSCCMRQVQQKPIVRRCRFWGQIFGIHANYFIVEADLTETEIETRRTLAEALLNAQPTTDAEPQPPTTTDAELTEVVAALTPPELVAKRPPRDEDTPFDQSPMPTSKHVAERDVPAEPCGTGLNRKTYFVCNHLGDEWTELPAMTCAHIVAARKIRKFFTGNLKTKLTATYPVFKWREEHLLRATIARITASTYVAPNGFYATVDDDENDDNVASDDEIDNNDKETEADDEYEPLSMDELLMSTNWHHYRPHILQQGRVNWFDVKQLDDTDDQDDESKASDDSERTEEAEESRPEIGPSLLTPCSDDTTVESVIPWTVRLAYQSHEQSGCAVVVMRSNLWHGAVSLTMAAQRVHDSLYVGWGQKFVTRNYSPKSIPDMTKEWPTDETLVEMIDPTVEEEEVMMVVVRVSDDCDSMYLCLQAWELAHTVLEENDEEEIEDESNDDNDDDDDDSP